jgi:pimeloyl-ACP methyl ester carboxylesterase
MPKVKANGITINYEILGDQKADAWLVLIGGLAGGNWDSWKGQISYFEKHFRILAFDNRGIGLSDHPEGPYETTMMAEDAIALMQAVGVQKAFVLAKSLGGAVAQIIAHKRPDLVRALVVTSSLAQQDPRGIRVLENWRDTINYAGWERFSRHLLMHFYTDQYYLNYPEKVAAAEKAILEVNRTVHGYMETSYAASRHNSWDILPQLEMPVLVMCGALDMVNPANHSAAMAAKIRNSELQIIPNSLHGFMAEYPTTLDMMLDFYRRAT